MDKKDTKIRPEISIVVPCYNVADSVIRCIESIRNQTYKNFIVLLIDDGSTDETSEIIKRDICSDKRFRLYHKSNGGLSSARNFGLHKVKTRYVCFIDSDDYIEPEYLELLYKSIQDNNSDVSACYANAIYPDFINLVTFNNDFSGLARAPAAWNKLYKTELFHRFKLSYPEGKCYEDVEVSSELLLVDVKFSIVKRPLYNYVQNPKSISHKYDSTIYDIYDVLNDIDEFAIENDLTRSCHDKIEFINIFQRLISTTTRAAHRNDFSPKSLRNILNPLESKYPNWYNNPYIITLPPFYRIFLRLIYANRFNTVYFALKLLNSNNRIRNKLSKFCKK